MRAVVAFMAVGLIGSVLRAQLAQPTSPQVEAAAADARDGLRQQVLAARVTPDLTVRALLDRIGAADELTATLRAAEQIGGTRWLDDETVQVRLAIDGTQVAGALDKLVREHASRSPIPPERLQKALSDWRDRTFAATGTSTGGADIERLRPPPGDRAWAAVPDAARRRALAAARDGAVSRVFDSLRPIGFDSGKTLDEALAVPEVRDTLKKWLVGRPVKSVEFGEDGAVHLELSAPPEQLWPVLKGALAHQTQVAVATGPAGWDRLDQQVTARVSPAVGVGVAQLPAGAPKPVTALLPPDAPPWVNRQADAEATANPGPHSTKLKTARAAEAIAIDKLRQQITELPLTGKTTVGDAALQDPRLEEAISRALGHARPYKVDYGAQGAVTVHVSIGLSDVWAELNARP